MVKRVFAAVLTFVLMFLLMSVSFAEDEFYRPNRKDRPLFVVNCDYAPEYTGWDEEWQGDPTGYYPAGTPIYNWCDGSDWAEIPDDYYLLDWVGDSTCIPAKYLSFEEPTSAKPPVFVDYCEEWVSLRKKPDSGSSRLAKLEIGTRIDHWEIYNSDYLYVELDGKFGYVSLDYLRFPSYNAGVTATVVNCKEWVSLRAEGDSDSERLMKVPLGTQLDMIGYHNEDFCICVVDGVVGFIDYDYIQQSWGEFD